jgi:hypothetical protein
MKKQLTITDYSRVANNLMYTLKVNKPAPTSIEEGKALINALRAQLPLVTKHNRISSLSNNSDNSIKQSSVSIIGMCRTSFGSYYSRTIRTI